MATIKEMLRAKKAEAELRAESNARKSKNVIKAGDNLQSQWGKVVTNEQRLIDNGHFMKSAQKAQLDYLREQIKRRKALESKAEKIVLVKR
jgi:predicted DNA-binding WGR domain protein